MKCLFCGKEYEARRKTSKYCGGKCRKLAFQQSAKVSVPGVSVPVDLEKCRYCGADLPALLSPRRHPGSCYPCALKSPRRASIESLGELIVSGIG